MYPPFHPAYHPYGYYPPPPFIPTGEGSSGEASRQSFNTYGERTEHEEEGFDQGRRSDTCGFFYTQQRYNEQMSFQNYVHTSLAQNEQNWNDQRQWNQTTTQTLAYLQEGQDQANNTLSDIFAFF